MALIYNADLVPSKIELLAAWVPGRPWLDGADVSALTQLDAFRFDDPDGEVGIETHLVESADGRILQIPLTYRSAPLPGADAALVGTTEHSVLGRRWVYDGCADPVYVTALANAVLTGGTQADVEIDDRGRRTRKPTTVRVLGSGAATAPVAIPDYLTRLDDGPATVISAGELELVVLRVLDTAPDADGAQTLTGTWAGHDAPTVLAVVRIQDARAEHRALLPEEEAAGSDDPELEARIILEDSDERTEHPERTKRDSVQTPD
jgi:hypothetical protein